MGEGRTSPWVWVGCGCLVAILAIVGGIVGAGWWGMRTAQRWGEELKDPATQRTKALAALGTDELPTGLHANAHLSIPLLMDVTILTDQPPGATGSSEQDIDDAERGLVYVTSRAMASQREDLRAFLAGEKDDPGALRNLDIKFGDFEIEAGQETLARGTFELGGVRYLYATQRQRHRAAGTAVSRLESLVMVQCPADDRLRLAVWFGPDPTGSDVAEAPPEAAHRPLVELTGTPADEVMLRELFAGMSLCP